VLVRTMEGRVMKVKVRVKVTVRVKVRVGVKGSVG
jgi:hypothetical protein